MVDLSDIKSALESIAGARTTKVNKSEHRHDDEQFHCLVMPKGTFIVRRDGKVSVSGNCRDEMMHCDAASWLYRTLKHQQLNAGIIDDRFVRNLNEDIIKAGRDVYEHELLLLDKLFEKGDIEGMNKDDIAAFVRHRVNECLRKLEIDPLYDESYNPLAKPFYDSISGYSSTDFFSSQGVEYTRGWSQEGFKMGKAKAKAKGSM